MDTRSKILTPDAAGRLSGRLTIVSGTFDILRAEHGRDLAAIRAEHPGAALLVVVLPSHFGWLDQCARARMVAALRVVDYVVPAGDPAAGLPGPVIHLESADERRALQLIEHVRRRQTR